MIQAFVLIQSAIHLYITPVQTIVMFLLTVFIIQNVAEIFYFKTMDFWGATLLPLSMSVITLIWMILFHLAWKPWFFQSRGMINEDETKHCLSLSHQFFQSNQSINKRIRKTNRYLDMKRFESLSSPLSFSSALPSSSSSSPSSSSASKFRSDNLCFNFTGRLDSNPMIRIRPFTSVKTSNESTTPSQSSSSQKTKESHID
ncbi:putative 2-oxoglutarate dehydrogenase E1 component DHKTD1 [Sarcoptes scabiei]|nr:putative 2-oxoglutarate dehydrogenase E1 component DHKTD1 [Sarcoptes scabiei]